jgi:hypothetical protein
MMLIGIFAGPSSNNSFDANGFDKVPLHKKFHS